MNTTILYRVVLFIALLALQVLVCNHIHLLGYATPLIMVYYIIVTPYSWPRWALLLEAFLMGLLVDVSTNTPGIEAAAFTLTAILAPVALRYIADPEKLDEIFVPSAKEMGWMSYIFYTSIVTLLFITTYYLIQWFTFSAHGMFLHILGSATLTILLLIAIERIRHHGS